MPFNQDMNSLTSTNPLKYIITIASIIILLTSSTFILNNYDKNNIDDNNHQQEDYAFNISFGTIKNKFQQWKQIYNVHFQSQFQQQYRFRIFYRKYVSMVQHNLNPHKSYSKGINQFSMLTQQQFKSIYLTLMYDNSVTIKDFSQDQIATNLPSHANPLKANIDWRTLGAVGPIKNQGICGSCWAFSTIAGLQAISAIFHGKLQIFSEQQLIDCDYSNRGCVGGQMRLAINYVKKNGINLQSDYPYRQVRGLCSKPNGPFKVSGWSNTTGCSNLANYLISRPIVVGLDANTWDDYKSGIFDNCKNDTDTFNHGVLLIGMSVNQYWLVKNSFGKTWGQDGFMRLKYGDTCNICDDGIAIEK